MNVAGYDVSYAKSSDDAIACLSLFDSAGALTEEHQVRFTPAHPYVPGELYRRELKGLELLLPRLERPVEVLVIDGCGTIHPRRFGAACEYHRRFGIASVGCAKNLLVGTHEPLEDAQGSRAPIIFEGSQVGTVYRSATGVKPIYISPGGGLSQDEAVDVIARFCHGFRIPEVIRRPDQVSREALRTLAL